MENGGHFGGRLEFRKEFQGDSRGLLVCCFTHIPGPILKNSACYEIFPGFGLYLPNALGLPGSQPPAVIHAHSTQYTAVSTQSG